MKKRFISLSLVLLMVATICCGCVNIYVDGQDTKETTSTISTSPVQKETLYVSTSKVIITTQDTSTEVSNDRLNTAKSLVDTYSVILNSRSIQALVKAAYPNADYSCDLKQIGNTQVYQIVVTSQEKDYLKEICQMITDEFCTKIPTQCENISVKIVHNATEPKELEN